MAAAVQQPARTILFSVPFARQVWAVRSARNG